MRFNRNRGYVIVHLFHCNDDFKPVPLGFRGIYTRVTQLCTSQDCLAMN